jgi:hypothetical protein
VFAVGDLIDYAQYDNKDLETSQNSQDNDTHIGMTLRVVYSLDVSRWGGSPNRDQVETPPMVLLLVRLSDLNTRNHEACDHCCLLSR